VEADASQLRQVILNLITNASEAIGELPGAITVATGLIQVDRAYLAETWIGADLQEGSYVCLEVTDTGCGMDRETLGRIFDPFFTTKFAGRGLGLAAVLGIIRGHRGAIRVASEPCRGTSFQVLLPASELPAEKVPDVSTGYFGWQGRGAALLVDDEELVRNVSRRLLERLGFRVLSAGDGREALEVLKAHTVEITCAVVDLTMPRLDGAETVRAMRAVKPDLRVLLSSGYEAQELGARFASDRFTGFLQKPYELADFAARLRELLER
jgi:CheY-like chemotaxis protein